MADLAPRFQIGETLQRVLQSRVGVEPVQIEDIDMIHPQPLPRNVELRADIVGPGAPGVARLGGDHQPVAMRACELAKQGFRRAIGIEMRGIEMGDTRRKAILEHGARGALIRRIAELHGAKGKATGRGSVGGGDLCAHGVNSAMCDP